MFDIVHFIGYYLQQVGLRVFIQDLEVILLVQINLTHVHTVLKEFIYN
jgi:hypothetical protein